MRSVLTVIGTRPEVIKLAPVMRLLDGSPDLVSQVCVTGQHTSLLEPMLARYKVKPDYRLTASTESLHESAASILQQFAPILRDANPDVVLVQGDTTTAFAGALAAYYSGIPVGHVEAGLRTGHLSSPWPEEGHRALVDRLTTYFFAPTEAARAILLREGAPADRVWTVGNTAIDAVRLARSAARQETRGSETLIVATIHRRENQGERLGEICRGLRGLAEAMPQVRIVVPIHPNPDVGPEMRRCLRGLRQIELVEPLEHDDFIRLLERSVLVVTDSGGIQEEASVLGKPVLVVRDTTERPEGIEAGTARLVGTAAAAIVAACRELLEDESVRAAMSRVHYGFGDGYAAERIVAILTEHLSCGVA